MYTPELLHLGWERIITRGTPLLRLAHQKRSFCVTVNSTPCYMYPLHMHVHYKYCSPCAYTNSEDSQHSPTCGRMTCVNFVVLIVIHLWPSLPPTSHNHICVFLPWNLMLVSSPFSHSTEESSSSSASNRKNPRRVGASFHLRLKSSLETGGGEW